MNDTHHDDPPHGDRQPLAPMATHLDRLLHEPSRLALVATLVGAPDGLSFNDLKSICELSDGNLSRHLKALEQAGLVRQDKTFVGVKPRTTVLLTELGRTRFSDYLRQLEGVLRQAAEAMEAEAPAPFGLVPFATLPPPHPAGS